LVKPAHFEAHSITINEARLEGAIVEEGGVYKVGFSTVTFKRGSDMLETTIEIPKVLNSDYQIKVNRAWTEWYSNGEDINIKITDDDYQEGNIYVPLADFTKWCQYAWSNFGEGDGDAWATPFVQAQLSSNERDEIAIGINQPLCSLEPGNYTRIGFFSFA
jgi:hypothetical protein